MGIAWFPADLHLLTTMDYVVDPTEFTISWFIMLNAVSLTCTALVLYGLYIVLFVIAIRALRQRNLPRRRDLIVTTLVMFFLGTCGAVVNITMAGVTIRIVKELVRGASQSELSRLTGTFFVLQLTDVVRMTLNKSSSNRLAFCILVLLVAPTHPINERSQLYRCYIIWGSKKKILILPALCSLATVVLTVISWLRKPGGQGAYLISFGAPFIMTLGTNLLLMLLTGRIWYKGRETQIVLGPAFRKKYNTAAALVLESGALYCFCLIPWAASQFIMSNSEWVALFAGISGALVAQTVVGCCVPD
ncbi:hypothetical protein B0H13DRAFT_2314840 [Mycena leptocephala]|nr:hypothetical protein B0H13DRAFT_2314840 [Mycena leptocephala]